MDDRVEVEGFPEWEIRRAGRMKAGLYFWHLIRKGETCPLAITKRRCTQGDAQAFARKYIEQGQNALG